MSYDGFYSDLSTRGSANDILNLVIIQKEEVEALAESTLLNADRSEYSANSAVSASETAVQNSISAQQAAAESLLASSQAQVSAALASSSATTAGNSTATAVSASIAAEAAQVSAQQAATETDGKVAAFAAHLALPTGSTELGTQRTALATAINNTLSKQVSQAQVDIWEFSHLVTVRPVPSDFSTWDWTPAFVASQTLLGSLGGGTLTFGPGGTYQASEITQYRFIVFDGRGVQCTEIKQLAGSNRDFIKSENFDILKGSGLNVNDPRVPSWFGLKDIRIDGNRYNVTTNPTGNTSGYLVQYYGPSMLIAGTVMFLDGAGGGLYTEDSTLASGVSWRGQEEGKFGNIICRSNGGFAGWHCRGPHNNDCNSIISGFNDGWNFYSEEDALWGGSFDRIGMLHSYAGGRGVSPAADTGVYLGSIARIDNLVVDGDNAVLQANELQIGKMRAYNIGGQRDGIVINGDNCSIGDLNGIVWSGSTNKTGLIINGNNARINGTLSTNNPNNDAVLVKGSGHKIDMTIRNFTTAGRTAYRIETTDSEIKGKIRNCSVGFNYISGTDNQVELNISTSAGQTPVTGLAPRLGDRIDIRSRGNTIGGCKTNLQTVSVAMDITTYTIVTMAHGLLYTPPVSSVRINWLSSSPDSSVWDEALLRVVTTTATDVVVGYKMATAAPAGTLARIGITIDLT